MQLAGWLEQFGTALGRGDMRTASALFEPGGFWRDLVAFTWNIRTCEGRGEIEAMLAARLAEVKPANFSLSNPDGWFTFETAAGRGVGHLRLRDERCWTLLTTLQELRGFEEKREAQSSPPAKEPYVVIVGGGQGGIALAARLKRLDVPAIVLEKNERAGDSWRKRYASLCLHDPVWYDHMPYLPFPEHWPVFTPKDRMGDWLEAYVKVMDLNYWASSPCVRASYEGDSWEVETVRHGRPVTLRPKHLVLATGMSGFPSVPAIPGIGKFAGKVLHSSKFEGGAPYKGRHCVVVGSGTSAHDICQDLHQQGAGAVTMVQRAPAIVVRSQSLMDLAWGPLYSEQAVARGITTALADLTVASVPFKVLPELQRPIYAEIRRRDADLYAGLDKVGFQYTFGEDGSGIHALYLRRGAGYYIETGASKMIIEGRIRLRSGVSVAHLNERSVALTDGTELPADLVVLATGYGSMNEWARELISPEVADKVGKVWGLGSDTKADPGPWVGELRNMWKPTAQPNLWFHGGNLMQSRHYSLYLALQLKARMESIPVTPY